MMWAIKRLLPILVAAVMLVLSIGCSFLPSSTSQDTPIVTAKSNSPALCGTDGTPFKIQYVVRGIEHGICVGPSSACAKEARIGRPLPQSCGG